MQRLVEDLLSEEYVRDLEERDLTDEATSDNPEVLATTSQNAGKKPSTPKRKAARGKGMMGRGSVIARRVAVYGL